MRLPPWLWHFLASKRTHRALILAPFALMILATIAYVAADKWGAARFEKEIAALKAENIPVTQEEANGPPPGPEDDVFQHPSMIRHWHGDGFCRIEFMGITNHTRPGANAIEPDLDVTYDVSEWLKDSESTHQAATRLLQALEDHSKEWEELIVAYARTHANYASEQKPLTPAVMVDHAFHAGDKALLYLAADETTAAFATLETLNDIIRLLARDKQGPWGMLCAEAAQDEYRRVIWQGIREGYWNASQLAELQAAAGKIDFQREWRSCIAILLVEINAAAKQEIATNRSSCLNHAIQWLKSTGGSCTAHDLSEAMKIFWVQCRPYGISQAELADALQASNPQIQPAAHLKTPSSLLLEYWIQRVIVQPPTPAQAAHPHLCPQLCPPLFTRQTSAQSIDSIQRSGLNLQTRTALLQCGIALERYRLKYGKHPESLNALVPEFLTDVPNDVCGGQPMRYRVLPDGSPHVWSLWPSGKDEGGMPHSDPNKGNMVWTTGKIPGLTMSVYKR